MKAKEFEEALGKVHAGEIGYAEFFAVTRPRWLWLAKYISGRWRQPYWVTDEDLVQELMIGAWFAMWRYDARRGVGLARMVVWNAVDKAKKQAHRWRGARKTGELGEDFQRSTLEVLALDDEAAGDRSAFGAPADQEDILLRDEARSHALAMCGTADEREALESLFQEGGFEGAALSLIERGEQKKRAVRRVVEVAIDVAGRLELECAQ